MNENVIDTPTIGVTPAVLPAAEAAPSITHVQVPGLVGPLPLHPAGPRIGNFHKGLQHDEFGEVVESSYQSMLDAFADPTEDNFEAIAMGPGGRKLVNPQAGLASDLIGPDPNSLTMPAPPALDSAEAAAEAVELYWMALLRDVPFSQFHSNPLVAEAAAELSTLQDFTGPRDAAGKVTWRNVFRGFTRGDLVGPYLSQFLLKDIPYGSLTISQRQRTVMPGIDYLTRYEDWHEVQDGALNYPQDEFDPTLRYIRTMRDLGQYVHVDALYEAYLNACLLLLGINAPVDDGNPYKTSQTQIGFGTFGGPHILSLVCEVATRALKAVWYQKWVAHRRLRPEAYGGLIHLKTIGHEGVGKDYPIHPQVLNSQALKRTYQKFGSCLLPMAFPEGSPTHPAYGAGHATVAGACVTILKAWFDDSYVLPSPVQPTLDGTLLVPYTGAEALTVGGELDKVAANISIGRNMAGVHWRTDYTESVKLGEHVAICHLLRQSGDYNEDHSFTFDSLIHGTRVRIEKGQLLDAASGKRIPHDCS